MSLIKPRIKSEKTYYRLGLECSLLEEIKSYCDWANFKKMDDFFEEAAKHILSKDKKFKLWKEKKDI